MKERPIFFSGPMMRALLAGKKTQTRRVVKPQPPAKHDVPLNMRMGARFRWGVSEYPKGEGPSWELWPDGPVACPYGEPGERLWVRETWRLHPTEYDFEKWVIYACDNEARRVGMGEDETAENWRVLGYEPRVWNGTKGKNRPPIFMPRWASRITLEVVKVRVERLQDISIDDAKAEGVGPIMTDVNHPLREAVLQRVAWVGSEERGEPWFTEVDAFAALWESIKGEGSWDLNPWVWVVEFRLVPVG